jgi:hypothetical protein
MTTDLVRHQHAAEDQEAKEDPQHQLSLHRRSDRCLVALAVSQTHARAIPRWSETDPRGVVAEALDGRGPVVGFKVVDEGCGGGARSVGPAYFVRPPNFPPLCHPDAGVAGLLGVSQV